VGATLTQQFSQELEDVNRALEKIEEGTYGLSDLSGEPILRGRLEAIPEAFYTIEEQQRREGERRPRSNLSGPV
jgi:DnaK suppressor protein